MDQRRARERNTWLVRVEHNDNLVRGPVNGNGEVFQGIAVRLHATEVVTHWEDDQVTLNSGGYRTVTTKARMNAYLPTRYSVRSHRGVWKVHYREDDGQWNAGVDFYDGITLLPVGEQPSDPGPASVYRNTDLEEAIRDTARDAAELRAERNMEGAAFVYPPNTTVSERRGPDGRLVIVSIRCNECGAAIGGTAAIDGAHTIHCSYNPANGPQCNNDCGRPVPIGQDYCDNCDDNPPNPFECRRCGDGVDPGHPGTTEADGWYECYNCNAEETGIEYLPDGSTGICADCGEDLTYEAVDGDENGGGENGEPAECWTHDAPGPEALDCSNRRGARPIHATDIVYPNGEHA